MSNEVRLQTNFRYDKNNRVHEINTSKWIDVSGDDYTFQTQAIGTSNEALDISTDAATQGVFYIRNMDATNYVLVGALLETLKYDSGVAGSGFVAGEKITGVTSAKTAYISYIEGNSTQGTLVISNADGTFTDNETLTGETQGTASANGTGSTAKPAYFLKLKPGEHSTGRFVVKDAVHVRADTAACNIESFVAED